MHKSFAVLFRSVTATVLLSLAGCSKDAGKAAATDTGGTLIISLPIDARTLYPPAASNSQEYVVINAIFDHLADIGDSLNTVGDMGFKPQLATTWTWAPDSLSIAFSINPKARWHDGRSVTAKDVQFTFRAYADTAAGSVQPGLVGNIDSVSIVDSLTPVVWFKRRSLRQFMEATYNMYVLPEHILGQVAPHDLPAHAFSKSPVGTGRFRFYKWEPGVQIEVVADTTNYHRRAKLDRVIWSVTQDIQASMLSVFAGESDFYEKMSPENLPAALKSKTVGVVPYSQVGYSFLTFNLHARKNPALPHPVLGDVRVRRALTMATDRAAITRIVLDTFATVAVGPAPRALVTGTESVQQLPFDIAHAKALLDSAGWVLPAGKQIREKNGVPLAFDALVTITSAPRVQYAQLLEQKWAAIGAKLNVRALGRDAVGAQMGLNDFDAWVGAYNVTPGLPSMPASWGTRGIVSGRNYGGYSNPRFDATVDSALNATTATKANALWIRALSIIDQDAPALWMFEERSIGIFNKRVRVQTLRSDLWSAYLADWSIDPAQRIDRDRIGLGGNH